MVSKIYIVRVGIYKYIRDGNGEDDCDKVGWGKFVNWLLFNYLKK